MKALRIVLCAIALVVVGCSSTITPTQVSSEQASFDGTEQNSGIVSAVDGGYVITERARARYNELVAAYGSVWSPAIGADYGVTPYSDGRYYITNEAASKFRTMNLLKKAKIAL